MPILQTPSLDLPWVESPLFETLLSERHDLADEDIAMARFYHENGYWILPNLIDASHAERIVEGVNPLFETARNIGNRIQDASFECEEVRELACLPRVLQTLQLLYGRKPIPSQTLNFREGTQQNIHSDTIHFSSLPARYMCGVWVALEDVTLETGPLEFYPKSHKLPEYNYQDLGLEISPDLEANFNNYLLYEKFIKALLLTGQYERKFLTVPRGTGLIWSSNLLHGGSPIHRPNSSRWSQVSHYFFEDCLYYSPMNSNPRLDRYMVRNLFNLETWNTVTSTFNGREIPKSSYYNDLQSLSAENSSEELQVLKERFKALEADLWRVRHSHSFRIGRVLTAPLRKLKQSSLDVKPS